MDFPNSEPGNPKGFHAHYLDYTEEEAERQQALQEAGLQEIEPVILPEPGTAGEALLDPDSERHFGWPVAAMSGSILVVAFHVMGRGIHVIRSVDAGAHWEAPLALASFRTHADASGPGMCALGATRKGVFVLSCSWGIFVSGDGGQRWTHRAARLGGHGNAGPRILDHPRFGLVLPYHRTHRAGGTFGLCFLVSADGGETWEESGPVSDPEFAPAEPTAFELGDDIAVFSRNHTGYPGGAGYHRHWCYFAHFIPRDGGAAGTLAEVRYENRRSGIYVRRMDTPDVLFNPVTGRIEAVTPKRNEGFPYSDNGFRSVQLWSMDPDAFRSGSADWRFECVLLRSRGVFSGTPDHPSYPPREGFHPGGGVLDLERGVHHLFVYSGSCSHIYGHGQKPRPRNPAEQATGIFRITRSLRTDRLRAVALGKDRRLAGAFRIDERFSDLRQWTPGGSPVALRLTGNKDIVERCVDPLREEGPQTGPEGLRWTASVPGYHGLHHESAAVTGPYRLSVRVRIEPLRGEEDGVGLGVCAGARKHYAILRRDGVYGWTDPRQPPRRICGLAMDPAWHEWTIVVEGERAEILRDGVPVGALPPMIEPGPGRDDAPLRLFLQPVSGPVTIHVTGLRMEAGEA